MLGARRFHFEMTNALTPALPIERQIRYFRSQKVMLDSALAELYGVPTKRLNEAVKRNLDRFPADFMFQLTTAEIEILRSQFATSKLGGGGRRYLPYVFTEHGVAMLSSVLTSPRAVQMNILIVRAFIRMRELVATNKDLAARVEKLETGQQQTASVIEVLAEEIDGIAVELREMHAVPIPAKAKMGFRH